MASDLLRNRPLQIFLGALVFILFVQALFPPSAPVRDPEDLVAGDCVGEPIEVPYAYTGSPVDPWSCQPQCEDDEPRYLLYTNGVATQCQEPPGCFDSGEDNGVTCRIPEDAPGLTPVTQSSDGSL